MMMMMVINDYNVMPRATKDIMMRVFRIEVRCKVTRYDAIHLLISNKYGRVL